MEVEVGLAGRSVSVDEVERANDPTRERAVMVESLDDD